VDKVKAQIEELLYENAADFEIAKVLKKDIKLYFNTLEESFANTSGKDFLVKHTKKIDTVLKIIYKVALRSMFGDYAPMKNSVPLGLVEVSKTDITIKTALIESRFIEGSHFIWVDTQNAISQIRHDNIKKFIELKLEEQKIKHRKFPLTMEPNLKEGVGGFRNANLVFWIGKTIYNVDNIKNLPSGIVDEKEYRTFRIALEFLFRVRSALHLATGKKEDKLRLDLIPSIAKLLGYEESKQGHMKFAKKVTESLKIIRLKIHLFTICLKL